MAVPAAGAPALAPGAPELLGRGGIARLFRPRLLLLSLALWLAFGLLTAMAATTTWLPGDLALARWVQSISWAPLAGTISTINWLSGGPQLVLGSLTIVVIFFVSRPTTPLALFAIGDAGLYDAINSLVHKPRPVAGLIHVTENAGAYAFPSGHATFAVTLVVVLLLCIGTRFLVPRSLGVAAIAGLAVVLLVGAERIYVGAHYPSDVLGGFLLASAWLPLMLSIRWLGDPVLSRRRPPAEV